MKDRVQSAVTLLFVNAKQVVTCAGAPRARVGAEMRDCGVRTDWAVAVEGERIAAVGPRAESSAPTSARR